MASAIQKSGQGLQIIRERMRFTRATLENERENSDIYATNGAFIEETHKEWMTGEGGGPGCKRKGNGSRRCIRKPDSILWHMQLAHWIPSEIT